MDEYRKANESAAVDCAAYDVPRRPMPDRHGKQNHEARDTQGQADPWVMLFTMSSRESWRDDCSTFTSCAIVSLDR